MLTANRFFLSLGFCISLAAQALPASTKATQEKPTLLRVLANPERYHGQRVTLVGYLCLSFESTALYLHQEDSIQGITDNALWVSTNALFAGNSSRLHQKYVIISGTFDTTNKGHMGLWLGSLTAITSCEPLEDRAHPRVNLAKEPPPPPKHPDR